MQECQYKVSIFKAISDVEDNRATSKFLISDRSDSIIKTLLIIRIETKHLLTSSSELPIVKIKLEDSFLELTFMVFRMLSGIACRGGKCDPYVNQSQLQTNISCPKIVSKFPAKPHALHHIPTMPLLRRANEKNNDGHGLIDWQEAGRDSEVDKMGRPERSVIIWSRSETYREIYPHQIPLERYR
jgi:hypothetical protein